MKTLTRKSIFFGFADYEFKLEKVEIDAYELPVLLADRAGDPYVPFLRRCFTNLDPSQHVPEEERNRLLHIAQRPLNSNGSVNLQNFSIRSGSSNIERIDNCVILKSEYLDALLFTDSVAIDGNDLEEAFIGLVEKCDAQLSALGISFENVIRTWIYIPGITKKADGEEAYKRINRARNACYPKYDFRKMFATETHPSVSPASTGIGTDGDTLVFEGLAILPKQDVRIFSLDNNRQTIPHEYPQYQKSKAPLFSRGVELRFRNESLLFVSGTASILNAESVHIGSIEKQTKQTIANMKEVIGNATCEGEASIICITVYLKNAADQEIAEAICRDEFGEEAIVFYEQCDICREELLVEIEMMVKIDGTAK